MSLLESDRQEPQLSLTQILGPAFFCSASSTLLRFAPTMMGALSVLHYREN
jgi:hypothetical protein